MLACDGSRRQRLVGPVVRQFPPLGTAVALATWNWPDEDAAMGLGAEGPTRTAR